MNRIWRPQLVVTGITGLSPVHRAGNVMIPEVKMRLSLRLPPTLDCVKAEEKLKEILETNPPYNAHVTVSDIVSGSGFNAPDLT